MDKTETIVQLKKLLASKKAVTIQQLILENEDKSKFV